MIMKRLTVPSMPANLDQRDHSVATLLKYKPAYCQATPQLQHVTFLH